MKTGEDAEIAEEDQLVRLLPRLLLRFCSQFTPRVARKRSAGFPFHLVIEDEMMGAARKTSAGSPSASSLKQHEMA